MREGAGANVTENPASDFLADSQACSASTNIVVMILIGHCVLLSSCRVWSYWIDTFDYHHSSLIAAGS